MRTSLLLACSFRLRADGRSLVNRLISRIPGTCGAVTMTGVPASHLAESERVTGDNTT